ncbi:X-ray repair cross-complementing protein 5 [Branchiostoma belcheri]|nr:X-ray repair cross-complementing protein 5 [Branchiostoma belcheri]
MASAHIWLSSPFVALSKSFNFDPKFPYMGPLQSAEKRRQFPVVDAIVVALDLVRNQTMGKKFETKRIVLFSNLAGEFTDDQLEGVINGMKALECEFNLMKERTPQQRAGAALIRHVIQEVDGVAYSDSEALQMLSFFQKRNVRAAPWKVVLEVGTNLKIPVRGFIRVKECKPNSFKKVHARTLSKDDIHTTHEHRLNDDEETPVESTIDGKD